VLGAAVSMSNGVHGRSIRCNTETFAEVLLTQTSWPRGCMDSKPGPARIMAKKKNRNKAGRGGTNAR
jgi:hypothetical protein